MSLLNRIFGKRVREGTRIYIDLNLYDYLEYTKCHYLKLSGYRGAFKKVRDEHLKGSIYRIYFVRENVSSSYKGEVKKIKDMPKEQIKLTGS